MKDFFFSLSLLLLYVVIVDFPSSSSSELFHTTPPARPLSSPYRPIYILSLTLGMRFVAFYLLSTVSFPTSSLPSNRLSSSLLKLFGVLEIQVLIIQNPPLISLTFIRRQLYICRASFLATDVYLWGKCHVISKENYISFFSPPTTKHTI